MNTNVFIEKLMNNLDLIKPEDIPNIDLYMDQVTTFMENHLGSLKRFDEDKILTKTMINNYAKNELLPPPEKKKYSKDHVIMLTFIYYFKSVLTISDIKTLTSELTEKYFHSGQKLSLSDIYSELLNCFPTLFEEFKNDIAKKEQLADVCFNEAGNNDSYLKNFYMIALLGIDVYIKKQLIEAMIDDMAPKPEANPKEVKKEKKASVKSDA